MTSLYNLLAGGRYAAYWLPEFLVCYQELLEKDGEEAAVQWAIKELATSLRPALSIRAYRVFRVIYFGWRLYQRLAR
jgi:hypothetical protein